MPDDRIQPDEPTPRPPAQAARDGGGEDEFDDRPRRRPYRNPDDEPDATGGLIPYKNGAALASYYTGVFSLIPCLGLILAPIALILGFVGLRKAQSRPNAGGMAHAIVGLVLGGLVLFGHLAGIIFLATLK